MADDNHTSIAHLVDDSGTNSTAPQDVQKSNPPQTPQPQTSQVGKEFEPARSIPKEDIKPSEGGRDEEQSGEKSEKPSVKEVKKIPEIPNDVKKAGLQVAPSAKPFPTIYDVKVPIYSDEQIESNLHKSFWTGARWLAELCTYLLWQSHIKLKKIGKKVIRQQG